MFERVGHHSWAAGVISRGAACVSDELDPFAHGLLLLHLSERQREGERDAATDSNFVFFCFFLSESPVYRACVFVVFCHLARIWMFCG